MTLRRRESAVILCVLGLTLAQEDLLQKFKNRFWWNKDLYPTQGPETRRRSTQRTTDQAACGCCLMHQQIDRMKRNFNQSLAELQSQLNKAVDTLSLFRCRYLLLNNVSKSTRFPAETTPCTISHAGWIKNTFEHAFPLSTATRSAFSVSLFTSDTQKCYGPFRDDTPIIYEHIFLNMGDHYDANTGVFTVPRTGVYSLALTIYSDAGGPGNTLAACGSLRVNGRLLTGPREFNMQDQEDSASNSLVVKLKTGDKVSVNLPIGCFLCDNSNHYNTFSGFLLYITD
ncbi:uncharacterized protein [Eucyclogobius newberryi]|uniref:uncharacterized protein n=1 Tax=Eucyclogobius newberryi TaxID=166745 RepID=UPI003B5C096A